MIQVGQKVYCGLYGGRNGFVYAIYGEQRPQTVGSIAGVVRTGGNAEFGIVFEDGSESPRLPETILYGVQWKIHDEVVSAEVVQFWRDYAASEKALKEAEAKTKAEEFKAAVDTLRANQDHAALQQTGPDTKASGGKLAALNIRRQLKDSFPEVKFSVTSSYDSVSVKWTDGPTKAEVEAITNNYSAGYFDGMEDIYNFVHSPWNTVFGGAKYITTSHHHTVEAMTEAVEAAHEKGYPMVTVKASDFDGRAVIVEERNVEHWHNKAIYDFLERTGEYGQSPA